MLGDGWKEIIAKVGIQIHLNSPGGKLLYPGIERDMYIINFEISYVNRVANIGRGRRESPWKAPIRPTVLKLEKGWTFAYRLHLVAYNGTCFALSVMINTPFETNGLSYKLTKSGQNVQLNRQEECCEPFISVWLFCECSRCLKVAHISQYHCSKKKGKMQRVIYYVRTRWWYWGHVKTFLELYCTTLCFWDLTRASNLIASLI